MTFRRVIVAIGVVGALACGGLAVRVGDNEVAGASSGSGPDASAMATPLWSARRVPQPFVDAVGARHLQSQAEASLAGLTSCFSVGDVRGALATGALDTPLVPASTEKLLVSAAALAILGPDTTLRTRAMATAVSSAGVVDRLYLVGGGDPLLATDEYRALVASTEPAVVEPTTSLEALADAIVAKGVRRITGGVVADDSRHETVRYQPTWPDSYRTGGEVGPLGALTVNHGFIAFKPKLIPTPDPALFAAAELTRLLTARGVALVGAPSRGKVPDGASEVGAVESAPMSKIVGSVLRVSDNLASETLVREIGVKASHEGTTAAGLRAAMARLADLGVPMQGVVLTDGSGLDRGNRVTCRALAATVALGVQPAFAPLWDLAIAGVSGTLADEMRGTAVEGKLKAKTGFLNGVTGLAGVVNVHAPLQFVFVANGTLSESAAIRLRAAFADVLAHYPESPAAADLVPAP